MMTLPLVLLFFAGSALAVEPGPKYPPTKGAIWPKPQLQRLSDIYYLFDPSQFKFEIVGKKCSILTNALDRYSYVLEKLTSISAKHGSKKQRPALLEDDDRLQLAFIKVLAINLTEPCERYPYFGMSEAYDLSVSRRSELVSTSVWGVLRGLESFSQLFYFSDDYNEVRINSTIVRDFPRYHHRGLLLDTSRHYISLENILITLDAMAMNKMNVLHWHIVDDQSFPYVSEKFPDLSLKGAYHSSMVYTSRMIETVVSYARYRGIRVMPEIDVPGHTRSWGEAYPNLLTPCYTQGRVDSLGPLNPVQNTTYKLLRDLFAEVQLKFPDQYFHIGGDEVQLDCWQSNPVLHHYMRTHNLTVYELHAMFMRRAIPLLRAGTTPVVWEEVYEEKVPLSRETLVQVWKSGYSETMLNVLFHGHKVLFSAEWYLDHLEQTFSHLYAYDPRAHVLALTDNHTLAELVVGGEACMWGEMADDNNLHTRVWPRASAVAEVLWSPARSEPLGIPPSSAALRRAEEHACRMQRRRVPTEPPAGPGFCLD